MPAILDHVDELYTCKWVIFQNMVFQAYVVFISIILIHIHYSIDIPHSFMQQLSFSFVYDLITFSSCEL